MKRSTLDQLSGNQKARVLEYQGGLGVRKRLEHIGIHPGDVILVVQHGALGGPILIKVHGFQLALGRGIASKILVEETE
jgi:ferrous iron transport protein A